MAWMSLIHTLPFKLSSTCLASTCSWVLALTLTDMGIVPASCVTRTASSLAPRTNRLPDPTGSTCGNDSCLASSRSNVQLNESASTSNVSEAFDRPVGVGTAADVSDRSIPTSNLEHRMPEILRLNPPTSWMSSSCRSTCAAQSHARRPVPVEHAQSHPRSSISNRGKLSLAIGARVSGRPGAGMRSFPPKNRSRSWRESATDLYLPRR
jgi:hypothetical protein